MGAGCMCRLEFCSLGGVGGGCLGRCGFLGVLIEVGEVRTGVGVMVYF